jgi:hypothetical protein
MPCAPSCTVTNGTAVAVTVGQTVTGVDFALQPKPGAFSKTNPLDGTAGLMGGVTLNWDVSAGAIGYEYCIDTTNDGACSDWISTGANTSAILSGLTIGTTYFWHVRATNSYGTTYSDGSDTRGYWAFSMLGYPAAFSKANPANGATVTAVTLSWFASATAASYEYCIDTTNDNACSNWTSTGSSTSVVLSLPFTYARYYWHVRATNVLATTYANGSATAFWSFDRVGTPGAFDRTSPANGSLVAATDPVTLVWTASFGAASYSYCIDALNDNACTGSWIGNGGNTSVTLNNLSEGTTYYWHVTAINSYGALVAGGDPAAFWSFRTTEGVPFTDPVLTAGVTPVRAVHLTELRTRINAQRVRFGLSLVDWMDPTLTAGATVIKRQHILQLRAALTDAYNKAAILSLPAPTYTDPDLPVGTAVKMIHIQELRNAVIALEAH